MKIFLSYLTEHKRTAGKIRLSLILKGFDPFLAHDDIEPTAEWADSIIQNLKDCDIFIPILTKGFENSKWVNQEIGIAYAWEKLIVPLKIESDPPAFISKYQALKYVDKHEILIEKITDIIAERPQTAVKFRDFIIRRLENSNTYNETEKIVEILIKYEKYSVTQILKLIECSISNGQIYDCFKAKDELPRFVKKHGYTIDQSIMDKFKKKIGRG